MLRSLICTIAALDTAEGGAGRLQHRPIAVFGRSYREGWVLNRQMQNSITWLGFRRAAFVHGQLTNVD